MLCCSECGQPVPLRLDRLGLVVTRQPRAVYWRGRKLDLSPAQTAIMEVFVRDNGRGTHGQLEMVATEKTSGNTLKVQISKLRHRLAANGMPAKIRAIYNEGYLLELEEESPMNTGA
jgi:DNA-binding response OmpR family regulator